MHHPHPHGCTMPEPEGADSLSYATFRAFMRALHLHRQLMLKLMSDQDSHPGQAFAIRMLGANDGASQRDLADALHLSRPAVTSMVQRMERAGLIDRRADETDQRLTRVYLTDQGRAFEAQTRTTFAEYIRSAFGSMSVEDRQELERLLGIVAENTERALRAPSHAPDPIPTRETTDR